MSKVRPEDHPDFIGGWKWSKLELDWINERIGTLEAAAQRQWVGLTDEEILGAARDHYNPHQRPEVSFARMIEAKLKEKNHGKD